MVSEPERIAECKTGTYAQHVKLWYIVCEAIANLRSRAPQKKRAPILGWNQVEALFTSKAELELRLDNVLLLTENYNEFLEFWK